MLFWILVAIVIVWIVLSATILVSVCVASSRFNQRYALYEENSIESHGYASLEPQAHPVATLSTR